MPTRYRSWPWITIIVVLFVGEITVQVIWYRFGLPLSGWVLTQMLLGAWLLLAVWRVNRNRAHQTTGSDPDISSSQSLDQVVRTEDLIGSIVHEIRNSLNRLNMRLQSVEDLPAEISSDLRELSGTVDRIETVFRGEKPEKRWIPFPRLMSMVNRSLESSDRVICRAQLSWLHCAPESLVMVLHNLIDNSLEAYGDASGTVVVQARPMGPEFCVTVADQAGGIDPDLVHTINRDEAKNSTGMGLGLMISQKIMEQHGGRMMIESEPDVGTTVTLTVPIPGDTDWSKEGST